MPRTTILRFAVLLVVSRAAVGQCEVQELTAPNPETDFYGYSVALSSEFAVVGAPNDSTVHGDAGAVYVYSATPSGWVGPVTLYASIPPVDAWEHFGHSVAISGHTILVGAPGEGGGWNRAARPAGPRSWRPGDTSLHWHRRSGHPPAR